MVALIFLIAIIFLGKIVDNHVYSMHSNNSKNRTLKYYTERIIDKCNLYIKVDLMLTFNWWFEYRPIAPQTLTQPSCFKKRAKHFASRRKKSLTLHPGSYLDYMYIYTYAFFSLQNLYLKLLNNFEEKKFLEIVNKSLNMIYHL